MNLKSLFPLFMLEYAGVLREFPRIRPGRFIRMRAGRGRLDEGRSGSTGCWPVGVAYPYAARIHLSFDQMRPGRFDWMLASRVHLP